MVLYGGVLIITVILLLMLIKYSADKLSIYFETFMYLSKKENSDKANYIANSSFYKYFYKNKLFNGNYSIEMMITLIMILLSILAFSGFIYTGHKNYGFLNYYYGDSLEYYFVNIFINTIITLAIIYTLIYMYWYVIEKGEDDKLEENELLLKTFIIDNLSYEYLYQYYTATALSKIPDVKYTIQNFVNTNYTDINSEDPIEIFKLCFTNEILNEINGNRYIYIKKGILDRIKAIEGINHNETNEFNRKILATAFNIKGGNCLQDFYIIANYNHNNNTALQPLDIIIDKLNKNITIGGGDDNSKEKIAKIDKIKKDIGVIVTDIRNGNPNIKNIKDLYEKCLSNFRETIKIYKVVYDKYSTYYMGSVLLSNFIITYAVLIFTYIIIKILNQSESFANMYSIYNFRSDLINYVSFILIIYFFITCPIIIFGFN